jgi:hypothetical protein
MKTLETIITDQEKERRKQDIKIDFLTDSLTKLEETIKQQNAEIIKKMQTIARLEIKKKLKEIKESEELQKMEE